MYNFQIHQIRKIMSSHEKYVQTYTLNFFELKMDNFNTHNVSIKSNDEKHGHNKTKLNKLGYQHHCVHVL